MAQRQASSVNDQLTIAGLLVLGLTSALVGALVVAPTLAPKRMAMAIEVPTATPSAPAPKQTEPDLSLPGADPGAQGTNPADETGATTAANGPGEGVPEAGSTAPNGPDAAIDDPVTIRKPGEVVGPPLPSGLDRRPSTTPNLNPDPLLTERSARAGATATDADSEDAKTLAAEGSRRPRERRSSDDERKSSTSRDSQSSSTEPDRTEPDGENDPKPDEGDDSGKAAEKSRVYRVQSGKFNTREEAQKAQLDLAKSGKGGFIVPSGDGFRLQLGVFRSKENAEKAADTARQQNIMVDVRSERQGR